MGRIIRVTDEVIEYRKWIKETFPLTNAELDSISSSTGSDASTLSAPASDTVNKQTCFIINKYIHIHIFSLFNYTYYSFNFHLYIYLIIF